MTHTGEASNFLDTLDPPRTEEPEVMEASAHALNPAGTPDPKQVAKPAAEPALVPLKPAPAASSDPRLPPPGPRREGIDVHRMVVGREIRLTGTIYDCDQLLIDGTVEADLSDCDDLQIAETGLFKGVASIGDADIRGRLEGTLIVRNLVIRATAKVTGRIRYVQLQIERGGQISGDVVAIDDNDAA
jgi:cytoskeletal protein CcmA (bactofilin family)